MRPVTAEEAAAFSRMRAGTGTEVMSTVQSFIARTRPPIRLSSGAHIATLSRRKRERPQLDCGRSVRRLFEGDLEHVEHAVASAGPSERGRLPGGRPLSSRFAFGEVTVRTPLRCGGEYLLLTPPIGRRGLQRVSPGHRHVGSDAAPVRTLCDRGRHCDRLRRTVVGTARRELHVEPSLCIAPGRWRGSPACARRYDSAISTRLAHHIAELGRSVEPRLACRGRRLRREHVPPAPLARPFAIPGRGHTLLGVSVGNGAPSTSRRLSAPTEMVPAPVASRVVGCDEAVDALLEAGGHRPPWCTSR